MSIYAATMCKPSSVRKHPNADNLMIATVLGGYDVIVAKGTSTETKGVFFLPGTQLSEEFAEANKLTRKLGGFLPNNRAVKPITIRGTRSEGLFLPIENLRAFIDKVSGGEVSHVSFKDGREFTHLGAYEVCRRYTPKKRQPNANAGNPPRPKTPDRERFGIEYGLERHYSTPYVKDKALRKIGVADFCYATEKIHGTSARSGLVQYPNGEVKSFYGSRNRIFDASEEPTSHLFYRYYSHKVVEQLLEPGETVYYEIVGFNSDDAKIQPGQRIPSGRESELAIYASEDGLVNYNYGCPKGYYRIFVYRLTRYERGELKEVPFHQVMKRFLREDLSIRTVPLIMVDVHRSALDFYQEVTSDVSNKGPNQSLVVRNQLREGVIFRFETEAETYVFKDKDRIFVELEHYLSREGAYNNESK